VVISVRDILKSGARRWGLAPAVRLAAARAAWPAIVGDPLAAATAPVTLRGQTLVVGATSPVAAQEIRLRAGAIVRALIREMGEEAVTRVVPVMRHRLPARAAPVQDAKPRRRTGRSR
jgi:hypothetical protein